MDPARAERIREVADGQAEDVYRAVVAAADAKAIWRATAPAERGRLLFSITMGLRGEAEKLARLESLDTGKPLRQAKADVEAAARYFEFYAGVADKLFGTTIPLGEGLLDYTLREPLGVSAQITSWNYPLQIAARGVAPALAAGNTVVLKPAPEAPLSTLRLGELALEHGVPPGVLNVVTGGSEAGAALAAHPDVDQITFTGSVAVGIGVMAAAAANVVPVNLELGGKSPNIVFADADLETAAPVILNAMLQNAGQSCSAGARLLVEQTVAMPLLETLRSAAAHVRIGPGLDDLELGPLISERQLERVDRLVASATDQGAELIYGGRQAPEREQYGGYFYLPTLVASADPLAPIAQEEVFGPVLTVLTFEDEAEAIALANSTEYGLVCGVWTRDLRRAHEVATAVSSGQVFINAYGVGGGVELPFGGYGKSGFGRAKGLEALSNYLQTKNVCVRLR
jgi:acyl-CoA reductase-like NAD-dependent aldehyde dehydrogenase